jgi:glycosyltransferase 2 family protein
VKKKYIIAFFKTSLAIIIVWYLFKSGRLTKDSLSTLFYPTNILLLLLSATAFLVSQILSSLRLVFLLKVSSIPLKFAQAFKLTMIGNFFNMVIPGMIGGDVVKGYLLTKSENDNKGKSSGTIVMDRILGLFALLLVGALSIIYLLYRCNFTSLPYQKELRLLLILSMVLGSLFFLLLIFGKNSRIRNKLKVLAFKYFRGGFIYYMIEGFAAVTKKRRYLIYTFFISIIVQLLSLVGLLVLIKMAGESLFRTIPLLAVSSVVMLAGIVPVTPGNIGWTELIATFGWSAIGSSNGAIVFFYWRIVTLLCSLPWGLFYLYPLSHKKEATAAK